MHIRHIFAALLLLALAACAFAGGSLDYPDTPKHSVADIYHGTEIADPYRWLENSDDPAVQEWVAAQEELTHSYIDTLPQMNWLQERMEELRRYDDEGLHRRVLRGERLYYYRKDSDLEKSILMTRENDEAEPRVLLDPNQWAEEKTLHYAEFSFDGRYLAYGVAEGGDESPVLHVMEVATGELLPDSVRGWQQFMNAWMPDNSGFFYTAQPLKGTVPEGEEEYWGTVWYHELGTPASEDRKVFWHDEVKEYYHWANVSEDGEWLLLYRGKYYANQIFMRPVDEPEAELVAVTDAFDAEYSADVMGDRLLITTNSGADLYRVMQTGIDTPGPDNWSVFIPEHERDKLAGITLADSMVYADYVHNAHTRIALYDPAGTLVRTLELPTLGSAGVKGHWSHDEVYVSFSSYTYPSTTFRYYADGDSMTVVDRFPVEVDVDAWETVQVWYPSQDGTRVSMFVVKPRDLELTGDIPVLLYGYGGFNVSMTPYFSSSALIWLEAGGVYCVANLRGGGEYGEEWHQAGMLENKQNVFDDFVAAGEYLIREGYTDRDHLAIRGGSNGGLLVGAAIVQRPDLFGAAHSAVPLLDMLRYHEFGYARVWAEEYGSADDPEQFRFIREYSPYHNVDMEADYPPTLITASARDARTHPLHARKMIARLQEADPDTEPILYLERKASGHHGGTTLSIKIRQSAEEWAFLMHFLGMSAPE